MSYGDCRISCIATKGDKVSEPILANTYFKQLGLLTLLAGLPAAVSTADAEAIRPTARLEIPGEKERQSIRSALIAERLDSVLLPAMRANDIDLWLVMSREHNVDPILSEIGGGWGGVRNAYLFFDNGVDKPEKIFIGSHELRDRTIAESYDEVIYYGYTEAGIRPHLRAVIEAHDPQRIGINVSETLPMADGLSWSLRIFLEEAVGEKYAARFTSAELLVRDFRTAHIDAEWPAFSALCRWTVAWEEEAFSNHVISVGKTTANDIFWWMRQRALELGLDTEFLPGVRIARKGENLPTNSPDHVIQSGDVLSVDAGLAWIDFRTDIKRTAYVLEPGETEPPASIQAAFDDAVRIRELFTDEWKVGAIAHEVYDRIVTSMEADGYRSANASGGVQREAHEQREVGFYSHSVGNATHDIGARVAIDWPFAYGDRVRYPLAENAWYSVEYHVANPIPEWQNRALQVRIEENARLDRRGVHYCTPPQESLLLVSSDE